MFEGRGMNITVLCALALHSPPFSHQSPIGCLELPPHSAAFHPAFSYRHLIFSTSRRKRRALSSTCIDGLVLGGETSCTPPPPSALCQPPPPRPPPPRRLSGTPVGN